MKKSYLAILILLIVALAGFLFFLEKKKVERISQEPLAEEALTPIRDRFLSEFKKTSVQYLDGAYKKVTVSDGESTFSFEVPKEWYTETRNSGEIKMTDEEIKQYFKTKYGRGKTSDYFDVPEDDVEVMSTLVLNGVLNDRRVFRSKGFPMTSVSSTFISYYPQLFNSEQLDFYIFPKDVALQYWKLSENEIRKEQGFVDYSRKTISGYRGGVITYEYNPERDRNSQYLAKIIFVEIKDKNKYLVIEKNGFSEQNKEKNEHLLNTLSFEKKD